MFKRIFSKKIGISPKIAAANIVIVASAFVWYFVAYDFLNNLTTTVYPPIEGEFPIEQVEIIGANIAAIAFSALLGTFAVDKLRKRIPLLSYWTLAGVFLSFIPVFLTSPSFEGLIAISIVFGIYFGFGTPAIMGYFANSTQTENRATLGGFTFLTIGLSFSIVGSVTFDILATIIVLCGVRLASSILFQFLKAKEEPREEFRAISYSSIGTNRTFMLYFVPWIMFNIIDYLTRPFTENLASLPDFLPWESLLIAAVAIMTGFVADAMGRKRLAILGFASLGIGYAILSFNNIIGFNTVSLYFYTIADGIAWGILDVILLFTIWGDFAQGRSSEKLYMFGALPYLLSNFMYVFLNQPMSRIAGTTQVFPFASFFLFLAVLPLMYAPETLPEKQIKERELKNYVEKAQKEVEKAHKKKAENSQKEDSNDGIEIDANPELKEILEQAEKYY
jgi:hypothetical protein